MLYDLIKREPSHYLNKEGEPYDTSFNDHHYYDIVEKIYEFAKKENINYAIGGAMALNLFYQKAYKTLKDIEIHIDEKDLNNWISFFESNIDNCVFLDKKNKDILSMDYIISGRIDGKGTKIEINKGISASQLLQKEQIETFKNIKLSVYHTIILKKLWDRKKDRNDLDYYKYTLQYFLYRGISLSFIPLLFLIKRNVFLKSIKNLF